MELILQNNLEHQQIPVERILKVFEDVENNREIYYANPVFNLFDNTLKENIKDIQKNVRADIRGNNNIENVLKLDIKMETGTGKTYVYTKTMFELHKRYGINKFIIAVPSLAIKAGTSSFINNVYVKRHFKDVCGYDTDIDLSIVTAIKKMKGKNFFPSAIRDYVQGNCQISNKIYVLLVNAQLLTGNAKVLKNEYDYAIEGYYRPYDAIKATKPFLIIDEPHRFAKDNKAYEAIINEIKPQCIIRFGATFPSTSIGKGKNKKEIKDYQNLLYDLNTYEAFNKNLIKGIAKEHFETDSKSNRKVKITNINNKESVNFTFINEKTSKSYTLSKNDSLSIISSEFEGITIEVITKNSVIFSNGQEKNKGDEFDANIFMESYQEGMLKLAIQRHFEIERKNFNRKPKIKTLALFFIDDISSYRGDKDSGKSKHLALKFEELLKERIIEELKSISEYEQEYKEYLEASLNDISACHAGYFSQDNSDSDEAIAQEVKEILFEKNKLLSVRNSDGTFNTRRFLFSKWTLKEGWDNPNVFTIAKLRSSGSEISKIQEVGRGLRLPVDEYGNRISSEEFTLNYIVDFTEKDFAQKLIDEINSDIPSLSTISDEILEKVAKELSLDKNILFANLLLKNFVDSDKNIVADNRDKFFQEYPEFITGLNKGKVTDRNKNERNTVKIRKGVYSELKDLWKKINEKYLLFYDDKINDDLKNILILIFESGALTTTYISSRRTLVENNGSKMVESVDNGVTYSVNKSMPYNQFLILINKVTNIPITIINDALVEYSNKNKIEIKPELINKTSASNICKAFVEWCNVSLCTRFTYSKANINLGETALTNIDGTVKKEIVQGRIGTKIKAGTPSDKYLYDSFAYDSPLELSNITNDIDEVIVYGKIPRRSVAIPTITGEFYSPDFMYVVKKKDGSKTLNLVVETKDVENISELRDIESIKIKNAKLFFEKLSIDGYDVKFKCQLNNKQIKQIIEDLK